MSDPTLANFVKSLAATAVGAKIVGPVTALDYGEMLANVQRAFPEYED